MYFLKFVSVPLLVLRFVCDVEKLNKLKGHIVTYLRQREKITEYHKYQITALNRPPDLLVYFILKSMHLV